MKAVMALICMIELISIIRIPRGNLNSIVGHAHN